MIKIVPTVKINPDDVQQALRLWNKSSAAGSPLSSMLLYQRKLREMGGNVREATNKVLLDGLNAMRETKYKNLIHKRYIHGMLVRHIANQMNTSQSFVYNMQKDAVRFLTQELEMLENQIILDRIALLDWRLPLPTYQNLVGMQVSLDQLGDVLEREGSPWIVCVVGMAGIGKTSLTDALLRKVFPLGPFEQVGWVSAKQDYYHLSGQIRAVGAEQPAMTVDQLVNDLLLQLKGVQEGALSSREALLMLEEHLKQEPHLIVIDNLETKADLQNLLPTLKRLSNPTRFVLTSRERLDGEPDVYHFPVPELSFESTVALIRQEANWRNVIHLKPATDEELRPIYHTVGGNPLAIYLIIGLTHIHRLDIILADLRQARSKKIKNLYRYIYRRAWDSLNELARDIFVQTALIPPSGSDLDFLLYMTGLPLDELREVLDLLGHLNLIRVTGKLGERLYSLHSLTRTFLLEEVINWRIDDLNKVTVRPLSDIVFDRCNSTLEAQRERQTDEATEMLEEIGRLVRAWRLQSGEYRASLAEKLRMAPDGLLCLEMGIATPEDVTEFQLRGLMRMLAGSRQSKPFQEVVQRYLAVVAEMRQQNKYMQQKLNFL